MQGDDLWKDTRLFSVSEIMEEDEEQVDYYLDRVLGAGQNLIMVAKPGVGKSFLAELMAFVLASGGNWFDRFKAVKPTKVLYLLTDGRKKDLRQRGLGPESLGLRTEETEENLLFGVTSQINLLDPRYERSFTYKALEQVIDKKGIEVVFFDSLYSSVRGSLSDVTQSQQFATFMALLRTRFPHVAWVMVHHAKKDSMYQGQKVEDADPYMGSIYVQGFVDHMWLYERAESGTNKLTQIKTRDDEEQWDGPLFIEFDKETKAILPVGAKAGDNYMAFRNWIKTTIGVGEEFHRDRAVQWGNDQTRKIGEGSIKKYLTDAASSGLIENVKGPGKQGMWRRRNEFAVQPQLDKSG